MSLLCSFGTRESASKRVEVSNFRVAESFKQTPEYVEVSNFRVAELKSLLRSTLTRRTFVELWSMCWVLVRRLGLRVRTALHLDFELLRLLSPGLLSPN